MVQRIYDQCHVAGELDPLAGFLNSVLFSDKMY